MYSNYFICVSQVHHAILIRGGTEPLGRRSIYIFNPAKYIALAILPQQANRSLSGGGGGARVGGGRGDLRSVLNRIWGRGAEMELSALAVDLELAPTASPREVKRRVRHLCVQHHPDRADRAPASQADAATSFMAIQNKARRFVSTMRTVHGGV